MTEIKRPDPDELLSQIKEEESKQDQNKGYLKIFLGYVAGVGKTYRMLSEARVLNENKKDIIVGIAETHGRKETQDLLKGLEVIPRKKIKYKEILLEEFDIDAVLKRKPDYVMVDELAHTNVPGSRHLKRYNDVEELLSEGITVYTTLNIQHIESVTDIIKQITGVEVKETVPDRIVQMADKIELVDLPTEELIERLKEGKVYIPEKAKQAMKRFFRERNLVALRELALRYATIHVDYDMDHFLKQEKIIGPWDASNRIMVCISSNFSSEKLIRLAHRFSDLFNVEWFAVYVDPSYKFNMKSEEVIQLDKNLKIAEELDAKVFRLAGNKISDEIVSFAQSKNITLIIMGHSKRSRFQEIFEGSVINEVIKKSQAQVLVVENENKELIKTKNVKKVDVSLRHELRPYTVSILSIGLTSLICFIIRPYIEAINIPMIFIIPVVISGLVSGRKAGILSSVLAVGAFDFLFVQPYYSFSILDVRFIPTFLVLLIVGIITSFLADIVKKQIESTRQREQFIASLYDFSKDLLISQSLDDILDRSTRYISELFNYDVIILIPDAQNSLNVTSRFGYHIKFDDNEYGVSNWVFEHQKSAGRTTETLSSSKWYHIPLKVPSRILGVLAIATDESIDNEKKHLIESFASIVSLTMSNSIKE